MLATAWDAILQVTRVQNAFYDMASTIHESLPGERGAALGAHLPRALRHGPHQHVDVPLVRDWSTVLAKSANEF